MKAASQVSSDLKYTLLNTVAAMPEYSQSAYRFGDYVAKFGVFPLGDEQKKLESWRVKESDPINILSQSLRDFHHKNTVTYSFCAQLLQNLEEQPVDDIGIEWDEKQYPFEQIATLEFEPQDSWLPEFRVWWWVPHWRSGRCCESC